MFNALTKIHVGLIPVMWHMMKRMQTLSRVLPQQGVGLTEPEGTRKATREDSLEQAGY